ncbi:MAG TPA: YIP1 family protein [Ignavibacteria bacterium]|jgi:hypothetical protein
MENETLNNQEVNSNSEVVNMPEPMSFIDKLVGVFTSSGEVFGSIKNFPPKALDWIIPTLILVIVVIASQLIQMNNPVIKSELRQKQVQAMQKYVDEGKMTQEQMDQALDNMEKMKGFQLFGLFIGVPVGTLIVMAFMALVYWLLVKLALKGKTGYGYVFVLLGLTNIIVVIQVIITLILSIVLGKFNAAPNVGLVVSSITQGPMYTILKSLDPFSIWSMIVVGIGLAKLSDTNVTKSIIWVFILWIIYILLSAFVLSKVPFFGGM